MKPDHHHYVNRWLSHVQYLAGDIGPRGSTTAGEQKGAEYCQESLEVLDLAPRSEPFMSALSIYRPHMLAAAGILLAFAIYPVGGRLSAVIATLITLFTLGSDLLELSFRDNPLRAILPKGVSQNVVATVPAAEDHRQDLILIGHIDSHRTPLIFKSLGWLAAYKAFTTVAFVAFSAQLLLYLAGIFGQWAWIWPVSGVSALAAILLAAMCLQADLTPFSAGANDNATGAGMVLALAEHLQNEPLRHTRVWLACTGCEEVQHYGAIDFFRRYRDKFIHPSTLVLESLGCAGPAWLTKEGIVIPFYADKELVNLASRVSEQHPEWGAFPTQINGGNTEMADSLSAGIPALTIVGMDREGNLPYWHQVEDTVDKIDPEVLSRAYAFVWAIMQEMDSKAPR